MACTDFYFAGESLSSHGFMVCDFDGPPGKITYSAGSNITFNTVPHHYGKKYSLVSTSYDTCLTASIQICKDTDTYSDEDMIITESEYREMMRWLNRREFYPFHIIRDDDADTCYFNVSFNVSKIEYDRRLYGLELTAETDAPFGYGAEVSETLTFTAGGSQTVENTSDEIGMFYPEVEIVPSESGDLTITNSMLDNAVVIKNCLSSETITMTGYPMIISTSSSSHDIANDFNYNFFALSSTYSNRSNVITSSLACTMRITYNPIIKDSIWGG